MACYNPYFTIFAFNPNTNDTIFKNSNNKNKIVFMRQLNVNREYFNIDYFRREFLSHLKDSKDGRYYLLACGKCIGCKIDKARDWSNRIYLESQDYKSNYFVTLTYENPPINNQGLFTLKKKHLQDFIKRLRKYFSDNYNFIGIRYFCSGEYGSLKHTARPHYHLILLNCPLELGVLKKIGTHNHYDDFISDIITKEWPFGIHTVNEFSIDTSFYVSRYTTKKLFNKTDKYFKYFIEPEFLLMSTHPGIGYNYFLKNFNKVIDNDMIFINGRCVHTFKYYEKLLKRDFKDSFDLLKLKRDLKNQIRLDDLDDCNEYFRNLKSIEENSIAFLNRLKYQSL